jgi:hypothetical protein
VQISILNGVYTDSKANIRSAYPVNMVPVPEQSGVSAGYLKPADGIVQLGTGPGADRGAINWDGDCIRVMGTKLVSVDPSGIVTTLGDVGGSAQVSMDYSFDRLGIASNGNLFYYDGSTLTQVTDPDLGRVLDVVWVDGYFMTTDGEYLVVTELSDPTSVNPLKYGSSEVDPDPVVALLKARNEVHAINRYTIEVFDNIGGVTFPFQRIDGAQIQKGAVGTHACCVFQDAIAFIGGGRNEEISVWVGANGDSRKISTREIDLILAEYTESELRSVVLEVREGRGHSTLVIQLPTQALAYDFLASKALGQPVWYHLNSGTSYRATNAVWCYGKWMVGDTESSDIGYLTDDVYTHWGEDIQWQFTTPIVYAGANALIHKLELVSLTGRAALGDSPEIATQYSVDGLSWSAPNTLSLGAHGETNKRIAWLRQGMLRNMRIQRFSGNADAATSFMRLEADIEGMNYG